uniref:Uncharacterized protein n=1 Tax=Caenorhabditis japonica TaxID=281687 RepID=A0A8R1IMC8_CAEJA
MKRNLALIATTTPRHPHRPSTLNLLCSAAVPYSYTSWRTRRARERCSWRDADARARSRTFFSRRCVAFGQSQSAPIH